MMSFSTMHLGLLGSILAFAAAAQFCPAVTFTQNAVQTSTLTINTVWDVSTAATYTTYESICEYDANIYVTKDIFVTQDVDVYVTQQVDVTAQVTVDDIITLQNTIIDYVTAVDIVTDIEKVTAVQTQVDVVTVQLYATEPACALVPTLTNGNFSTGDFTGWNINSPSADYSTVVNTNPNYLRTNNQDAQFAFPGGSTASDVITIEQTVQVCPGLAYDFIFYATSQTFITCSVRAVATLASESYGGPYYGDWTLLFSPSIVPIPEEAWSKVNVAFIKSNLNSNYVKLGIESYCTSNDQDYVWVDSISFAHE